MEPVSTFFCYISGGGIRKETDMDCQLGFGIIKMGDHFSSLWEWKKWKHKRTKGRKHLLTFAFRRNGKHPDFGGGGGQSSKRSGLGVLFGPKTFNSRKQLVSTIWKAHGNWWWWELNAIDCEKHDCITQPLLDSPWRFPHIFTGHAYDENKVEWLV